ncbi:ABC transporter permease [Clostridium formicaceticum]|uniref:Transport permease protein n=1 Tax=Clostridium formicaceticum TaxID=1497 RepID=A0AAC9RGX5_9CLOT|nr:ABC transporter permease [Clostridium formicaceticum]AOY75532.1 hypothetical protein BJL90_06255 [Clostridium formicaceticum]ARE85826.1 Teichoic acid translocation permease protein TagG [Clostridium formicaceticum]
MKVLMNFCKKVKDNRYLINNLVSRDIKSRYVGSILGIFWTVIQPLSTILIYYFVFSVVLRLKLGSEYGTENFAIWLTCGLVPWMFFAEVINRSINVIADYKNLITKTVFSSEMLSVVTLATGIVNHIIAISLVIITGMIFGFITPSIRILYLPIYGLSLIFFTLGMSWFIAALNVYFKDIGQMVTIILNLWFYFTPIVFPPSSVPLSIMPLLKANPMFHVVEGYRMALLNSNNVTAWSVVYTLIAAITSFALGGYIFKKLKKGFVDVL